MLDHITNDVFEVVVVVVVVEFYATIVFTSNKMYSVGKIDKNQIRNE